MQNNKIIINNEPKDVSRLTDEQRHNNGAFNQIERDDENLVVTWNRWEQSLMKKYLMQCLDDKDPDNQFCFGSGQEVYQLHSNLMKYEILEYRDISYDKITTLEEYNLLVNEIKEAIHKGLKKYNGKKSTDNKLDYYINNEEETKFLTKFAMAIQDTKSRGQFYPEGMNDFLLCEGYLNSGNLRIACRKANKKDKEDESYSSGITYAKSKLLTLASLLTRISVNRETTAIETKNIRDPIIQNKKDLQTYRINVIDTNNFLAHGVLRMDKMFPGELTPFNYYTNLYRKLFDFALERQKQTSGKNPRFMIPLTGYWEDHDNPIVNPGIKDALTHLMKEEGYENKIVVDIFDHSGSKQRLFNSKNGEWKYGSFIDKEHNRKIVDNNEYEDYTILSGDHFVFVGNECKRNWKKFEKKEWNKMSEKTKKHITMSHEAFAMKTDIAKVYSSKDHGFDKKSGYWKVDENDLSVPVKYYLYQNYINKLSYIYNSKSKNIKNQHPQTILEGESKKSCCSCWPF